MMNGPIEWTSVPAAGKRLHKKAATLNFLACNAVKRCNTDARRPSARAISAMSSGSFTPLASHAAFACRRR